MFSILCYQQVRRFNFVKYVEEDQIMRIDAVASWGLDRVDQQDLPLDNSFTPRSKSPCF